MFRPYLECCVQIWSPYLAKDMDLLERVQIRATKLVMGVIKLSYESRLKSLGSRLTVVSRGAKKKQAYATNQ